MVMPAIVPQRYASAAPGVNQPAGSDPCAPFPEVNSHPLSPFGVPRSGCLENDMPRPRIEEVLVAVADLKRSIDGRLDGIDSKFVGVGSRFDGIDSRLDGIDRKLDKHDAHFGRIDQTLLALDLRVERLDERLTGRIDTLGLEMAGGFDRVDARLGRLEDEYQAMKQGLRRLEEERLD